MTSPTDVEVHQKVNLQDAKVTEENLQTFKSYAKNMKIYSPKILLILVEHL